MSVYILLTVLNGEPYLRPLLESILCQSYSNWTLLLRDDGSADDTLEILQKFALEDDRIHLQEPGQHLGVVEGFDRLLGIALEQGAERIFFCDADDVWHHQKLEKLCAMLQECEEKRGANVPLLAHSDLGVIDQNGKPMASSLMKFANWHRPQYGRRKEALLTGNFVTGCALALNRAAAALAYPIPASGGLHDGWSALLVAWSGELLWTEEALVEYRLHGANVVGVASRNQKFARFLLSLPASFSKRISMTEATFKRARAVKKRLEERGISTSGLHDLVAFSSIPKRKPLHRILTLLRLNLPRHSWLGKLALFVTVGFISEHRCR